MVAHNLASAPAALAPPVAATEAWQRVGAMRAAVALLDAEGADTDRLLCDAGLTRAMIEDAEGRVLLATFCRFYAASAAATGRGDFGLRAGAAWRIDDLGALATLMRSAATVGEALRIHARFQFLNSQSLASVVRRNGDTAEWTALVLHPPVPGFDLSLDHIVAAAFNFLRDLAGDVAPVTIELAHRRPVDITPYRRHFGGEVVFDAPVSRIVFPASALDRRLPGADSVQLRALLDRARRAEPKDIILRTQRAIAMQIRLGDPSADAVAAELALHRRSLGRRLAARGTTLQAMTDAARLAMAQQLLAYTEAPLERVAAMLGYAGAAPFVRAFTRWAGISPGRWRVALSRQAA